MKKSHDGEKLKRNAGLALIAALGLLWTCPGLAAAATYFAGWKWELVTGWTAEQTTSTPPALVSHVFTSPAGTPACGSSPPNNNGQFYANAFANRVGAAVDINPALSSSGSCMAGGTTLATSRFNVTFNCPAGTPSPIAVRMRFQAQGMAHVTNPTVSPPDACHLELEVEAGKVGAGGVIPSRGIWVPEDAYSSPSGVFSSDVGDNSLSGQFIGAPDMVNIDANGVGSAEFALSARVRAAINRGAGYSWIDFNGSEGVWLPVNTPIFELPAGCSCESVEANIVSNCIGCPPVSVAPASWSQVKGMFTD